MPKVRSQRSISRVHTTSVKPINRTFAVQDNAVQHLDVGALKEVPADEILHSVGAPDAPSRPEHIDDAPNKKQKRFLKHELFIERLEASRAPYSKSHARRLKRKEKEQLAGDFGMLQAALPSIAPTAATTRASERSAGKVDVPAATVITTATSTATTTRHLASAKQFVAKSKSNGIPEPAGEGAVPQPTTRPGQIGEGKGTPLTRSQRRRALKLERFRQPLIRSNPEFTANSFETIRTHARNTLIPHCPTT